MQLTHRQRRVLEALVRDFSVPHTSFALGASVKDLEQLERDGLVRRVPLLPGQWLTRFAITDAGLAEVKGDG